jgi:hypothetical protein
MTVTSPFASGQLEQTPQWSNFLDEQTDVRSYLQFGGIAEPAVDARLQLIVDFACQWVQNYLGRPIAPTTFTRRFSGWSGWNGAIISLPYYPVLRVVKLVEWWGTSGPHELKEQTPEAQGGGEMFQLAPLQGQIIRSFQGLVQRPFFPGLRNIECEWEAGYNPVPADIKIATLELIAHWWRNTQQASRSVGGASVQEYDPEVGPGMWQGIPHRVVALLSPFTQQGIG